MNRLLGAPTGPDLDAHLRVHGAPPLLGTTRPGRLGPLAREISDAGLRGRGGGWFPMARKLEAVAAATGTRAPVVVVNAMEGEPLSGKDAHLLAVAPHLVLDGAVLAAETIGARGVIVAVPEGPRAAPLAAPTEQRRARGIDPVRIEVREGPERYLSGQETALVNWIGGRPPLPTGRVPFRKGVGGRATLVGNAETYAHLALIARRGAPWFREAGSRSAPGTLLVTVSGDVARAGVMEVPVGTRIGDVLQAAGEKDVNPGAVLLGGYGGTFLPADQAAELPLHPDALRRAGATLGPGIVSLLGTGRCGIAETARIARWMADQGARQCGPCMFGLPAVAADLEHLAFDPDAAGAVAPAEVLGRLRSRVGLLPGRGACAHPDGVARLVAGALTTFNADAAAHADGYCLAAARAVAV